MIFYGYFRSSAAYRCRIAFHLLNIQPEMRYIHLTKNGGEQRTEEFAEINPQKLVPALDVDGEILTQSLAIIEYLNTEFGGNLLGSSAKERARIQGFSQIIACDIHPLQNLRVLQYIASEYGQSEQAQKDAWCQKWLGDGLEACEAIAKRYQGQFLFGDEPSLADICLIPQIFSAQRFHVPLERFPRLMAVYETAQSLPAFRDAAPAHQADKE